ncbi:MAG: cell envelope integrity protein TolA [Nitrospirae bacterium]|nr:cell envelope integrity protein TolA [Nitrospirota bacterium]
MRAKSELSLFRIIVLSAILHLILLFFTTIPLTPRQRVFKDYYVNLVSPFETATRESIAGSGNTIEGKQSLKADTKSGTDTSAKTYKKLSHEIERLRAIEKLKKIKKFSETAQKLDVVEKKRVGSYQGSGIAGSKVSGSFDSYYSAVTQKIWQEWIYPDFKVSELEVVISIKIGKDGKILSAKIEKPSGNRLFDRSALKAVSKASPLPPPPEEMEIGVRFYL